MLCQGTSIKSVFNFVTVAIQCVEVVCSGSEGCAPAIQLTCKKCERANTGQMEDSVVRVDRLKSINTPDNTSRPKGAGSWRGVYCLGEQNISGLGGSTISSVAIAVPWLLAERQTAVERTLYIFNLSTQLCPARCGLIATVDLLTFAFSR